jgi:hypothetical protein
VILMPSMLWIILWKLHFAKFLKTFKINCFMAWTHVAHLAIHPQLHFIKWTCTSLKNNQMIGYYKLVG